MNEVDKEAGRDRERDLVANKGYNFQLILSRTAKRD